MNSQKSCFIYVQIFCLSYSTSKTSLFHWSFYSIAKCQSIILKNTFSLLISSYWQPSYFSDLVLSFITGLIHLIIGNLNWIKTHIITFQTPFLCTTPLTAKKWKKQGTTFHQIKKLSNASNLSLSFNFKCFNLFSSNVS